MTIKNLAYDEVLDIYRSHIEQFGGYCAIRDNNALLAVIANPQRQFGGRDLYPTLSSKAAILVFSMIKNHPFVDGNKRTAFICGRVFLRLNGFDVNSIEAYYNLILKIAEGSATKEDVAEWFEISIDTLSRRRQIKSKEKKP